MHSHRSFRLLHLLFLLALLLAPWSLQARPSEDSRAEPATGNPIRLVVQWLADLWAEAGCTWDPDGGACRDNGNSAEILEGTDSLDAGCTWDPNGGCRGNG